MSRLLPIVAILWFAVALSCRAADPLAVPIDGEPFPARLVAADADWKLTLAGGGVPSGSQRTMPAADLAWWGTCGEPARGPLVLLADGGVLAADVAGADKDHLTAESDLLGTLKLPLGALAGVVFRLPADRARRDLLLDRVLRATGESDRVILDNGDEVTGLVEAIRQGKIHVRADAGPLDVPLRQSVALVLNPALRQKPAAGPRLAWAGLSDGSRLRVMRLAGDGARLTLTPAMLGTPPAAAAWKIEPKDLVFLLPLGGRVVYLSDLKPDEYRQQPYLDLPWPYHADRNVTGGLLRSGGRLWLKGLGVHSAATLSYALDGSYRRFQADVGIDDSTGGRGSVGFRVLVDGRPKYSSGPVRGGAAPLGVTVDLAGAKRLDLVVDYGEQGDVLDHADWLGARLVK
ncbi:MAG: NPCBM/NEW2 domain-containing protein [Thermoguttaceae bacterium]|jgi:hypothetical protein